MSWKKFTDENVYFQILNFIKSLSLSKLVQITFLIYIFDWLISFVWDSKNLS